MAVFSDKLPLGWQANDFKLKDTDEKLYSPSDFKGKKGLLIVFSCNHCPYAKASWPLVIDLFNKFKNDDEGWKLFYHGRINDNWQEPKEVKEKNLEDAFNLLLKGQDPPQTQPPSMGCSIKWI